MSIKTRTRLLSAAVIATVIPIGLIARSHRIGANAATPLGFLATYLGDTLWPIMFYFMGRFCFPMASCRTLLLTSLSITLTLEFGQLWNPPTLQWLRQQPVVGFILGNHFIWSDVVCCVTGALLALLFDILFVARVRNNKIEQD